MKRIIFLLVVMVSAVVFSQKEGVIKGTVSDQALNNEPMLFANVQLKGVDTNYQTNFHGNFEISDVQPGAYTLVISYVGYNTKEITLVVKEDEITTVAAKLAPIQISFDDVAGMDVATKDIVQLPTEVERSPRK